MQPTKYHSQAQESLTGVDSVGLVGISCDVSGGDCAPWGCPQRSEDNRAGREAPLDLIEEHLTYEVLDPQYRRGSHAGVLLKNWMFPADWNGVKDGKPNFVLKVQPFSKGGYEATIRQLDLEKIGRAMEFAGVRGSREAPEVVSVENQLKAASRAKRRMRHLVKNMMADHLVTFTRRESEESEFWTGDQWAKAWDKFRRLLSRVIGEFPYVAILEKHKKGNFHLHVAWCGRVNVGIVRKMWLAALGGGKGCGNIDAKKIKVPAGGDRAARIARYISKYVSKHFEDEPRFNKKRYWASRQSMEEARRYVLNADTLDGARREVEEMLDFSFGDRIVILDGRIKLEEFFQFPDGSGVWWAHVPGLHDTESPF